MQQLQFVELDEGGRLVVLDGSGTRYAVPVDDRVRAALRPRPVSPSPDHPGMTVSPRDVQSMIRAGQTAEEVAASTGWQVERVRRFEGPVLAEREHVVGLAQRAPVRAQGRTDGSHTLGIRVRERLQGRDVELTGVTWDAARTQSHGPWTVQIIFSAGGKERRAAWHYDVQTRALETLDDEARWLSEDEQALPGGLAGHPLLGTSHAEDEAAAELMATMRERRQRRSRRQRKEVGPEDPRHVPGQQAMPHEVLPLEDLPYDPDTMGDPPAAHPRGSSEDSPAPLEPPAERIDDRTGEAAGRSGAGSEDAVEDVEGEDGEEVEGEQAQAEPTPQPPVDRGPARPRRERRRLRMPKLAGAPPASEQSEPEGTFARTRHDPHEVSFDEFFGTGEDDLDYEDEVSDDGPVDEGLVDEDDAGGADAGLALVAAEDEPGAEALSDGAPHADDDVDPDEGLDDEAAPEDADDADETDDTDDGADQASHDGGAGDADDDDSEQAEAEAGAEADDVDTDGTTAASSTSDPAPGTARPGSNRKGRTSVPSWDDIMFGSRDRG